MNCNSGVAVIVYALFESKYTTTFLAQPFILIHTFAYGVL